MAKMSPIEATVYYLDHYDGGKYKIAVVTLCGVPTVNDLIRGSGKLWQVTRVQFNVVGSATQLSVRAEMMDMSSEIATQFQMESGIAED